MDQPEVRLGLIGAGHWGRAYIRTIRGIDGVRLARLCSSNIHSARRAPPGCLLTIDWKVLTSARDLDGVIIATPPDTHAEIAMAAIHEGLPVMVEKPVTASLSEAVKLHTLAAQAGVPVLVDHTQLFHPAYRRLKELAPGLGRIQAISSAGGHWRALRHPVSPLWDYGAHDVALSLDFMGQTPESVQLLARTYRQVEDTPGEVVEFRLEFSGGIFSSIVVGNAMVQKQRFFAVQFQDECFIFDDDADEKLVRYPGAEFCDGAPVIPPSGSGEPVKVTDQLPLTLAVEEFVSGIRDPHNLPKSFGTGLALEVTKVLDALDGQQTRDTPDPSGD